MRKIDLKRGNYEITLLTKEEYEEHIKQIPKNNNWWWLRTPGFDSGHVAFISSFGSIYDNGYSVLADEGAVRPALKSEIINIPVGEVFSALGNRWLMINKGFAISKCAVAFRRYDSKSNIWETSELKAWLDAWAKDGES